MHARGFTLVEVIIAVGIVAIGVVGILGLVPPLTRQSAEVADLLTAQHLPAAVRTEMRRLASGGFDGFALGLPRLAAEQPGFPMVAGREGIDVMPDGGAAHAGAYFLIELWRFDSGPLGFVSGTSGELAVAVRVSWPYRQPGGAGVTRPELRDQYVFATGIER